MSDTPSVAIKSWLDEAVELGASDLHLVPGYRPTLRLHGRMLELDAPKIDATILRADLLELCPSHLRETYSRTNNLDFALQLGGGESLRRFRVNYFSAGDQMGACFRIIAERIPDFEWAGFPRDVATRLTRMRNGLVLFSGVAGAGKSTSLAMIINELNRTGGYRIITIEEPIEFLFPRNSESIVTQREVGQDVGTFADGLKFGLRQDPDVILVGEIRDKETARIALSAAETGHLVFSTLHTRDAKGAISRYVDLFEAGYQNEVRSQLAMSLRAVVSQHLLPPAREGDKRALALEIMINNDPIAAAIRTGRLETIDTNIQTGRADGNQTLDESLRRLYQAGKIDLETAQRFANHPAILNR